MYKLERKKTKKRKYKMRGQITLDIREGVGVFVLLIIAAAVIAITGGVSSYILNSLGPATNKTIVNYGNQAIMNTSSTFVTVVGLVGGLVLGFIAFGFLRRIWKEFTS
jgi:hypothetical protein